MAYGMDVEVFISEVEKYPEIWDLESEDNRHRSKKQRAWERVARLFVAELDGMSDGEKAGVYKKLHSKWRNIRDSYVRDLKRRDGKKGYMYARRLGFLDELYKSSAQAEGGGGGGGGRRRPVRRRRTDVLAEARWASDAEAEAEDAAERPEFVDAAFSDPGCSYAPEDEDRSFFESLLPAVRLFDVDQKLEFRSEVIRLLKELRSDGRKFKIDPT